MPFLLQSKPATMAISAVNSPFQPAWQQLQLLQARRSVDQAERYARGLQAQANSAQLAADQAQTEARTLASQAAQAQTAASMAQIQLLSSNALSQLGAQISNTLEQVIPTPAAVATAPATPAPLPAAVSNTQGETIGTVINTTV